MMHSTSIAHARGSGQLLTKETIMKRLGIKRSKFYELLGNGEFGQYVKVGSSVRVFEHELEAYIERNQVDPLA